MPNTKWSLSEKFVQGRGVAPESQHYGQTQTDNTSHVRATQNHSSWNLKHKTNWRSVPWLPQKPWTCKIKNLWPCLLSRDLQTSKDFLPQRPEVNWIKDLTLIECGISDKLKDLRVLPMCTTNSQGNIGTRKTSPYKGKPGNILWLGLSAPV